MCYNTISRHCYEILNPKCAKGMDTIGIHYKYLERARCPRHCYEVLNPKCAKQMDTIGIHYKHIKRPRC